MFTILIPFVLISVPIMTVVAIWVFITTLNIKS